MQSLELPNPFRSKSRSSSNASTANLSLSSHNNPQPSLDFTRSIEEIRRVHIGRDGNNQLKSYVPEHELRAYWTDTRVRELSQSYLPHLTIKHEVVAQRCLRLFSALVYTNRVQFFDTLQSKLSDEQLPLVQDNLPQSLRSPVFKEALEDLYEHQWIFCPMILDYARLTDLELQPDHILPFQHIQEITQGDAAHIFKVKIDKSCNRLHPRDKIRGMPLRGEAPSDGIYVLKSYHGERYRRLFLNEAKAFTTLHQKSGNEHIVGYYGSFIQSDKFNLLLQFANAGSLLDYYRDPPPTSQQDIRQFWGSLLSVLKGLHQVHQIKPKNDEPGEYRGIHEDIKPDNILLIKGGTSKSAHDFTPLLTDFGHSHFRVAKELEEEEDDMGVDRQGNQTYGAPEASKHADYLLRLPNQIPTAADIWSMGCVISDAAAWLAFGPKGREEYRKLREEFGSQVENFEDPGHYDCFHDAVGRSQAVDKMHVRIREACHPQDTITPQLLDLVQEHMLVWDWKQRLPANSVFERCRKILSASERNKTLKDMVNKVQTNVQNAAKRISESSMFREKEEEVQDEPSLETTTSEPTSPNRNAPELKDDPVISQRPAAASRSRPKLTPFRWTSKGKDKETSTQSGGTFDETVTDTSTNQDLEEQTHQSPPPIEVFPSPTVPPRPALAPHLGSHSDGGALSPLSDNTELAFDISRPSSPARASSAQPVRGVDQLAKLDLSLEEATKWRNDWKNYGQLHPEQHRIIKDLQATLKGRDHIFFIDDSRTMKPHSSEVETALETLAYIVKPQDGKDSFGAVSVAIRSTSTASGNRPTMLHTNSSQTSRLVDIVRQKCTYQRIEIVIEDVFSDLVDKEIIPRLPLESPSRDALAETSGRSPGSAPILQRSASSASRRSGSHSTSNANPISVIVLTNGQWGDGKAGAGIDGPIRRLTHQLKERELKRTQVMIQFLRFGNDENGIRHLDYLGRLGREDTDEDRGYSIVDTQPVTGNLCSILIGSIASKL
ncbi:hypothetical protein QBC37DRAFT_422527 [Rhypophila decipiens]|uniref:Protein kinase domain-containing protein n=1 Tax=Rhypophila decipiens TaxID=261697 RepID=A0AAN7BAA0_9PEZI|nr:hypothetical protein QBC37DRAFT_422527 [Rhypophila decipiens]